MSYKILVPIASGTEEMEAITMIDIFIRAGYQVTVASADFEGELTLIGSRGIPLVAQCKLVEVADDEFDVIALPGGVGGSEVFQQSTLLVEMLKQHKFDDRWMAAICAAPALVLEHHNLYPNAIKTCHPSFQSHIAEGMWRAKRVTIDVNHKLITSQGPGTALEFAMEVIIQLSGKAFAWSIAEPMVTLPTLHYHKMGSHEE